jgi:hypothetical protein
VTAASYRSGDDLVISITGADSVAALRETGSPYQIFTIDEAADYVRSGRLLPLHPLCGGVPPDVAWPFLQCALPQSSASNRAEESIRDSTSEATSNSRLVDWWSRRDRHRRDSAASGSGTRWCVGPFARRRLAGPQ